MKLVLVFKYACVVHTYVGERHLPGLGEGSRQKMGEEQEEGRDGSESGGDEEAGRCAMPAFCF